MKKAQKHLLLLAVCTLLAGMLAGCGKADPDPNSGMYVGTKATMMGITMDVDEVLENGVTFDLRDGGKGVANIDGDDYKIKWTTDGDKIHIEGSGAELDGTIGGGDMLIVNMMDMGMDLELHCDELLHSDLEEDGSTASGSILKRLKDAKDGKDVYNSGSSSSDDKVAWSDPGDTEDDTASADDSGDAGSTGGEGDLDGSLFLNPDYESVSGKEFSTDDISIKVPEGWNAFEISGSSIRVIKGGSSADDYFSNASISVEWHGDASGSLDSSNMDEPITFSGLKLGDHDYNGVYGTVPGDWSSYMMMEEYEDGYILVVLSLPPDSDVYILDADVQAIMASVEV